MGRAAKYFTLEERKAAKREQAQAYRNSEKGKATKAEANRRVYQAKRAGAPTPTADAVPAASSSTALADTSSAALADDTVRPPADTVSRARADIPDIPVFHGTYVPDELDMDCGRLPALTAIPDDLFSRADKTLRASFAVHGRGSLLGLWTPPYCFVEADEDVMDCLPAHARDGGLWSGRAAVLGAFQYRAVLRAAKDRRARWSSTSLEELEIEVQSELAARVEAWRVLRDSKVEAAWSEDEQIALDWGAKIVCMLAEEWECRKFGADEYSAQLRSGEMPWQRLVVDMMALSHDE